MEISFEVSGDVQVRRKLLRFADRATDMSPAFEKMHDSFLRFERRQFNTQGQSGSAGWAPLKPATAARKARLGQRPEIMRATDALRRSLTNRSAPGHVKRISRDEFFFGTDIDYAAAHQNPRPTSHLPRRRVVELTERQRRAWVNILQRYIVSGEASMRDVDAREGT